MQGGLSCQRVCWIASVDQNILKATLPETNGHFTSAHLNERYNAACCALLLDRACCRGLGRLTDAELANIFNSNVQVAPSCIMSHCVEVV